MRRKKDDGLLHGLEDGARAFGLDELGEAIGESLNNVAVKWWLSRGRLPVAQPCPMGCGAGPFTSVQTVRKHLISVHSGMNGREITLACDRARYAARDAARDFELSRISAVR